MHVKGPNEPETMISLTGHEFSMYQTLLCNKRMTLISGEHCILLRKRVRTQILNHFYYIRLLLRRVMTLFLNANGCTSITAVAVEILWKLVIYQPGPQPKNG